MVKVVHVPAEMAACLSHSELTGWMEGVKYTPSDATQPQRVSKRRVLVQAESPKPLPFDSQPVSLGVTPRSTSF